MPITQTPNILVNKILDADSTPADELRTALQQVIDAHGAVYDVTIPVASVLTLFATPYTVLDAPDAGYAWQIVKVVAHKAAGVAYAGIAVGEDLTLKYTNAAGAIAAQVETTGFLDQATTQVRQVNGIGTDLTPVSAAPIVAHMLAGEITTGDQPIKLKITARLIPTAW